MRSVLSLSAALALATAGVASASVIPFSPTGNGSTVAAASLDFLPGNALFISPNNSTGIATIFYQARLGAILDSVGHPIPLPGLNGPAGDANSYEITAVFGVDVLVDASSSSGGPVASAQFYNLGTPTSNSYFTLYFDRAANASDLAGTGFRDGTPILSGPVEFAMGSLALGPDGVLPLDAFNPANYPGVTSSIISGGIKIASDADTVDANFFPGGGNFGLLTDTTLAAPYFHTDPSALFEIGPDGSAAPYIPNIGLVDGMGPDTVLESDGATGFMPIPEPASITLLPAAALFAARRRRK